MAIRLRSLTPEEQTTLETRLRSRTIAARDLERARIIVLAAQGERVPAIAQTLERSQEMVRSWTRRFNREGLAGLAEAPRSGRPPTYTPEEVAEVITTSLMDPQSLGLPFSSWTLDRLQAYLNEAKHIAIKRSRIDDLLLKEGLRWRQQETWFGERLDPDFAEKRGSWSASTKPSLLTR